MIELDVDQLRARVAAEVTDAAARGRDVDMLRGEVGEATTLDALWALAAAVGVAPVRADWPYDEPDSLEAIHDAADPGRAVGPLGALDPADAAARAAAAFEASVCGCVLGKPFEFDPTLAEIRAALEPAGDWPLSDYIREPVLMTLRERQGQWRELVRERITHVAPDDDINYTVLGMVVLEQRGLDFTQHDLLRLWLYNLPVLATFGPERSLLARAAAASLEPGGAFDIEGWAAGFNPGSELCGALIRADAYGYACLGHPALAADLAWRDAAMTHRGTGIYGAMFVAAAIAAAPLVADPLEVFRVALGYVPQRSRFAEAVRFAIDTVSDADDWLGAYGAIHDRFGEFGHCRIFQEVATLVNTLRFATDVGDGICRQVMQGNDTDSFGATAGSILGAWFGPDRMDRRWLAPFGDRIHLALATTHEESLSRLTARMAGLPALVGPQWAGPAYGGKGEPKGSATSL